MRYTIRITTTNGISEYDSVRGAKSVSVMIESISQNIVNTQKCPIANIAVYASTKPFEKDVTSQFVK